MENKKDLLLTFNMNPRDLYPTKSPRDFLYLTCGRMIFASTFLTLFILLLKPLYNCAEVWAL